MTQRFEFFRGALTRDFARHYAEMAIVMLVGMAVLAIPAQLVTDALLPGVDSDDPTLMLARMAVIMTLPMIPWMRWRGHGWQPCLEMATAMVVPAMAVIALSIYDVMGREAYGTFMRASVITVLVIIEFAALASLRFRRAA